MCLSVVRPGLHDQTKSENISAEFLGGVLYDADLRINSPNGLAIVEFDFPLTKASQIDDGPWGKNPPPHREANTAPFFHASHSPAFLHCLLFFIGAV